MRGLRVVGLLLALLSMAAHGATVNGQVRRSDTNAPIAGAFVSLLLLSENGDLVQFVNAQTDAGGNYSRGGLGDGDWRAFASATGFASEAYLEIPCPPGGCFLFFPGTFIPLAGAQVVNGIDFTLEPNGTVTGVVRRADTQAPLANVDVLAVTASVGFVAGGVSDANGVYTMSVPAGTHYVITSNQDAWIDELHDDIPCAFARCDFSAAPTVSVVSNQTTSGIDFALARGGRLGGVLTDLATGQPVQVLVSMQLYDAAGQILAAPDANGDGTWRIGAGLPSGSYRVVAQPFGTYGSMVWDNQPCAGELETDCDPLAGDLIAVTAPAENNGINFALRRVIGELGGRVTELAGGTPLANVQVDVLPVQAPIGPQTTSTNANGEWSVAGLPPGQYLVVANTPGPPLLSERSPGNQCLAEFACGTTPQPLTLATGEVRANVDFALAPAGSIEIGLRNADTAALMAGELKVLLPTSLITQQAFTNIGAPGTVTVLNGGPVHLAGRASFCGVTGDIECLGESYPDLPCVSLLCDLADSQAVNVAKGQAVTGIELSLGPGGTIEGTVTATSGGAGIPNEIVEISTGDVLVANAGTDADGDYRVVGLGTGPYFARTRTFAGYIDELYDDLPCPAATCSASTGTPLQLAPAGSLTGIDFALALGNGIRGTVRASDTTLGIAGAQIRVYDALGNGIASTTTLIDGSYATPALSTGSYFVLAEAIGFGSVLYQGFSCGSGGCDPLDGTPVGVLPPDDTTGIDFELTPDVATVRPPTLLYLNACEGGCTVRAGSENSINDTSSIISGTRNLPPYPFDQGSLDALTQCVKDTFAPYNVRVVSANPGPQPHHELMMSTTPAVAGFGSGVGGVSPFSCGVINNAITFLFAQAFGDDTDELCAAAAMELAHSFGLEHAFLCEDPMTYLTGCGRKRFTDQDVPCGEYSARACTCGGGSTNSHRKLIAAVGRNPVVLVDGFEDPPPQPAKRVKQGPPFQRQVEQPHCDTMSRASKQGIISLEAKGGGSR